MNIVVTGAAGFLGQRLIDALLIRKGVTDSRGQFYSIEQIKAFDVTAPPVMDDKRVVSVTGDIGGAGVLEELIDEETVSVFHLAAITLRDSRSRTLIWG